MCAGLPLDELMVFKYLSISGTQDGDSLLFSRFPHLETYRDPKSIVNNMDITKPYSSPKTFRHSAVPDVARLRECCRSGPHRMALAVSPSKQWEAVRARLFAEVRTMVSGRISSAEISLLDYIGQIAGQGRKLASSGNIEESSRLFCDGRAALSRAKDISEETALVCDVELAAAEAYLDCFSNHYEQARLRLRESHAAAGRLDQYFGYSAMRTHQIHVLNNLIRVEALAGTYEKGFQICSALLRYLDGAIDPRELKDIGGEINKKWDSEWDSDGSVRDFLTSQTMHEVALLMTMIDHGTARREAALCFENAAIVRMSRAWPKALRAWFDLKSQFLTGGSVGMFLTKAQHFLEGEDGVASPLLWFATALDVAAVCECLPGGGGFQRELLEGPFCNSIPNLIPVVRLKVSKRWARVPASPRDVEATSRGG